MTSKKVLDEALEILVKTATLGTLEELPTTQHEYNKRIWRAFQLGKKHQLLEEGERDGSK